MPASNIGPPHPVKSRTFRYPEGFRARSLTAAYTMRVPMSDKAASVEVMYLVFAFCDVHVPWEESILGNERKRDRGANE